MTKDKSVARASFWQDLFHLGVYKRNQGRIVRQITFAAVFLVLLLAAWSLFTAPARASSSSWVHGLSGIEYLLPSLLLLVGTWGAYRLVNYPQFADFLIAVEAEMNKVSWPSRTELIRSSLVVIFMMFFLAIVLFGFDLAWLRLFQSLGVVR